MDGGLWMLPLYVSPGVEVLSPCHTRDARNAPSRMEIRLSKAYLRVFDVHLQDRFHIDFYLWLILRNAHFNRFGISVGAEHRERDSAHILFICKFYSFRFRELSILILRRLPLWMHQTYIVQLVGRQSANEIGWACGQGTFHFEHLTSHRRDNNKKEI